MIRWIGDAGWHMSDLRGHFRDAGEVRDGKRRRRLVHGTLADLGTELMTFADHDSSHAPCEAENPQPRSGFSDCRYPHPLASAAANC